MRDLFNFMINAARKFGDVVFRQSMVKQTFLTFMMMVSVVRAVDWDNEASLNAVCDNSTMYLTANFTKVFQGGVYQSRGFFVPRCSYMVPPNANVTEVELAMPFADCDVKITEEDNKTMASTEIVIQIHPLLDSIYDKTLAVSCEIDNFQLINDTDTEKTNPFEAQGLENSWIEFKNGHVLLGEVGEPTESSLFMVVSVRDGGSNQDMIVRSCFAHTDKNVTNSTTVHELSNFYGCPDATAVLANFTVMHPENAHTNMLAYAPIANFSLIASSGLVYVSCAITICENSCPAQCNDTESPIQLPLSEYVTKEVRVRGDGAVMPDSLRDLNAHNDRSRRTSTRTKRSIRSFFSSFFRWESLVMTGSVSEGNITNATITNVTRKAHGLVVKHAIFGKDSIVSPRKTVNVNLNSSSSSLNEQFQMDWETFRFIALMTICMFITVVACYCCYADDVKKSQKSRAVF